MLKTKLLEAWVSYRNIGCSWHSHLVFTYWYLDDVDPEDRNDSDPYVPWEDIRKFCLDKFFILSGQNPIAMVICELK